MLHFFNVQQRAFFTQQFNNQVVRFEDVNAVQPRISSRQIRAVRANRVSDFQTVFLADGVVVRTVAACGMHRAGAGIQGHVIAQNGWHVEAHKRMSKAHQLQLGAFYAAENGVIRNADALHYACDEVFRQNQRLTVDLHQRVVKLRRQGDRTVRRQGPRRRGPDHQ